jgi:hypothetical protein
MDERLRFVARLFEGEKMAPLCAEFGISRRTGYKILDPYKDCGVTAFTDRSRRPYRQANRFAGPNRGHHCPLEARVSRVGRPPRSARNCGSRSRGCSCRRSAPSTPYWIATIW